MLHFKFKREDHNNKVQPSVWKKRKREKKECVFSNAALLLPTNAVWVEQQKCKKTTKGSTETKRTALSSPLLTIATAVITTTKGILGYQVTFVSPFAV